MTAALFCFAESAEAAERLARALGIACHLVSVRRFPDGESLVRVPASAGTAILYRSLDNPNAKLVEIMLAASALRDGGASRVVLVAPYLAYMRQDMAFSPGEAVSQRVIGRFLAGHFDAVLTVDPHLHRISSLGEAIPGIPAVSLSAASVLGKAVRREEQPVLVGPDGESRQWVESIAAPLGLDILLGEKQRHGDREVTLVIPGVEKVRGRPAVLVDDVISSGTTLITAADLLLNAGATQVEALTTHCLASRDDLARLRTGGVACIRSTDSVAGPTASVALALLLAQAIRDEAWLDGYGRAPC